MKHSTLDEFSDTIVSVADMPISFQLPLEQTESEPKRSKVETNDESDIPGDVIV